MDFLKEKGIDISPARAQAVEHIPNLDHYQVIIALAKKRAKSFPAAADQDGGIGLERRRSFTAPGSLADVRAPTKRRSNTSTLHVRELVEAILGGRSNNSTTEQRQ